MAKMDLAISVGEARARFFEESGFPPDGGMSASFVAFWNLGPIPIGFPNSNARRRALQMHDLHHVATGYPPTWTGEAEISAWELATGCGEYAFAWTITLQGLAVGLFVASQPAVPKPFGPAANGIVVYGSGGDLYAMNADGSGRRLLASDRGENFGLTNPTGRPTARESSSRRTTRSGS